MSSFQAFRGPAGTGRACAGALRGAMLLVLCLMPPALSAPPAPAEAPAPAEEGVVRVGALVYGGGQTGVCFADDFLDDVARQTDVRVQRRFVTVELASEELFNFPFVVMSGEGAFTLSDVERRHLKDYLDRGGFVLASAGCSNAPWRDSFLAVIGELYGEEALQPLGMDHPVFHTVYDIDAVRLKKAAPAPAPAPEAAMLGLEREGRLGLVFSPFGLNDTGRAGGEDGGCCCCGGNEIRNAREINVNLLAYALIH